MDPLSRELLLSAIDALDTGVVLLDAQARIIQWNAWMEAASGVAAAQACGRTLSDLFPEIGQSRLPGVIADALELGAARILTHTLNPALLPLQRDRGQPLLHNVTVQRAGSPEDPICVLQVIDVTKTVERERVLRDRQNARYRAVVDTAADAIITTCPEGKIQWANLAAGKQFGFGPNELTGKDIGTLLDHGGAWPVACAGEEVDNLSIGPVEIMGRRQDGSTAILELSTACWSNDRRTFVTGILRDVAPRQRAEGALRAAAAVSAVSGPALLQALVRELAEGLGVKYAFIAEFSDPAGRQMRTLAQWCNGQVDEKRSFPLDDLPWEALKHGEVVSVPNRARRHYPAAALLQELQIESFAGTGITGSDGRPIGLIAVLDDEPMTDIGTVQKLIATFAARLAGELERQSAENALRQLNAELEERVAERTRALRDAADELSAEMRRREDMQATLLQSQKLEALGQLVGGVAHDFNNILAAILGSYQLIDNRVEHPTVRQVVAHGRKAAERAAELIRHLLAFARREELKPRAVMLAGIIPSLQGLFAHTLGSQVEVRFDVPADAWPVLVDQHRLEVALLNLAVNARDAMPGGGVLEVSVSNRVIGPSDKRFAKAGDYVAISVRDNGAGMAPETVARALEPFFTTKEIGKGTGLGLAMVHGFVEQSGGRLFIESRLGSGTCIRILLPRAAVVPCAQILDGGLDGEHGDAVILVVDDDDQVRPVTATILRDLGYTVMEAVNAETALALGLTAPQLDMVLCDVVMPGADGPAFAEKLRAERPHVPFVFMTGHADRRLLVGATVIDKPFTSTQLAEAVLVALGRSRPGGEEGVRSALLSSSLAGIG